MNPASPANLPAWLRDTFGLPYCQLILDLYDQDAIHRVFAFHGPGTHARNYIRENTHGWTDQQIDNALLPILRRACEIAQPRAAPAP